VAVIGLWVASAWPMLSSTVRFFGGSKAASPALVQVADGPTGSPSPLYSSGAAPEVAEAAPEVAGAAPEVAEAAPRPAADVRSKRAGGSLETYALLLGIGCIITGLVGCLVPLIKSCGGLKCPSLILTKKPGSFTDV
jgi:hypothetical protein